MVGTKRFWISVLLVACAIAFATSSAWSGVRTVVAQPVAASPPDTGGPDAFGYTYDRTVPYNWIDATDGVGVPWRSPGPYPIGFNFDFYGTSYNQFYLNAGFISFGRDYALSLTPNQCIPSRGNPNAIVAPLWDLIMSWEHTGHLFYKTTGSAPNRMLVLEWYNAQHDPDGRFMTFEIILYEGSNDTRFQYASMLANSYGNGKSATVGIENQDGTIGLQVACNEAWITDNSVVHFVSPAGARWSAYLPIVMR